MLFLTLAYIIMASVCLIVYRSIKFAESLERDRLSPKTVLLEDFESLEPPKLPSLYDPATKSLSLIIPAYNEEERLGSTLDEALSYLMTRRNRIGPHFTYEVIVMDDGSRDGTVRVASGYVKKHGFDAVRVLKAISNRGKGHSVKRAMMMARGERMLLLDADGATRLSDLEKLEEELSKIETIPSSSSSASELYKGKTGVVFGSRAHMERAAMAKRSPARNFLTWGFHILVTTVAGSRIRDTQCGFKLFTRRAASLLFPNQRLQRWCFDVELLYLSDQLDIPVSEVPVQWTEMPGSKIRAFTIIDMAFELFTLKLSYQILGLFVIDLLPNLQLPKSDK